MKELDNILAEGIDMINQSVSEKISTRCIKCGECSATLEFNGDIAKVEVIRQIDGDTRIVHQPVKQDTDIILASCNTCGYAWTDLPSIGLVQNIVPLLYILE